MFTMVNDMIDSGEIWTTSDETHLSVVNSVSNVRSICYYLIYIIMCCVHKRDIVLWAFNQVILPIASSVLCYNFYL